jgi:D-serine deaminase-like pyridoxal phosphate-dependent protein
MDYAAYCAALAPYTKPLAFLDLDALDQNIQRVKERVLNRLPIRVASKSIRCVWALGYIKEQLGNLYGGLMTYSPEETVWLSEKGFDNMVIGYPYRHPESLKKILAINPVENKIVVMTDLPEHLDELQHLAWSEGKNFLVCIDIDMSTSFPFLYFGVYRSSLNTEKKLQRFLERLKKCSHLQLAGVMGYEAQISGVQDRPTANLMLAPAIRLLKKKSIAAFTQRRQKMVKMITDMGWNLAFVNGGGTGSLETSIEDCSLTEVTVGSAFFAPALFDGYDSFAHQAAAGFALEVTRNPAKGIYTCAGGGYVASGAAGKDKLPVPWLPEGLKLVDNEGAGEVQTPILAREPLKIGATILFRHAKAGELCERFNALLLLRGGKVVGKTPTYRGEGQFFL